MINNKRGQFYLIISFVLAAAVFGITARANTIDEAILFEDFEDLTNNYISESEYVINNALGVRKDVEQELDDFTKDYVTFAKQRDPNLQLLYIYSNGKQVNLVNHFNSSVNLTNTTIIGSGETLLQDILISVGGRDFSYKIPVKAEEFGVSWYSEGVPSTFDLSVAGFLHSFDLESNGPEFKVVINLANGNKIEHVYNPGNLDYEFLSPPQEDVTNRQVRVRK